MCCDRGCVSELAAPHCPAVLGPVAPHHALQQQRRRLDHRQNLIKPKEGKEGLLGEAQFSFSSKNCQFE